MATRSVSPGGALLRSSRMFSIPPPLPRPAMDSTTATSPYPLHQSITTPYASLQRGDWGLKRPLPLRSTTRTSTPVIRINAVDTHEHITDFKSSADHTMTLQKWQEMDIPLTVQSEKTPSLYSDEPTTSVFEDNIDTTVPTKKKLTGVDGKWRFKGPWLGGQTDGEFVDYLQSNIKSKKGEFKDFLREKCAVALTKASRERSRDGNEHAQVYSAAQVTETQLNDFTKRLRKERKELYAHIAAFLDLAPTTGNENTELFASRLIEKLEDASKKGIGELTTFEAQLKDLPVSNSPYRKTGPPKTHPSAGLSYSRTAARVFNHPEHGPQEHKSPIEARILLPRIRSSIVPVLGVGGFTAQVPGGNSAFRADKDAKQIPGLQKVEPDKIGGSKTWVHPQSASIDTEGKVQLHVVHGNEMAVAVKEGKTAEVRKVNMPAGGFKLSQPARPRPSGSNDYFKPSSKNELDSLFDSLGR